MSLNFVGYETLPVDVIKSAMVPVGFAASNAGAFAGPGEEGYYGYPEPGLLKDALVEWPAAQQVRTFYLARWRLCNDPKVREKIEKADQEVHRRNHDRLRITEALRAKRSEKGSILSQVKILENEDVLLARILEKKEPNIARESGLCSSEEELNDLLSSMHYRISNCSISEQRRLSREIKRLEMTREKVRSNAAIRAWVLEMSPEYATQGQLPEEALEEVQKKQEAMRENIKLLNGEVEIVDGEIKALEEDLADVTVKRDRAYTRIQELRKQRDDSNGFYYRNRAVLKDAMELAATNDVATLEEVAKFEVESFFSLWNSDRSFRENYMRRIRPSLDLRQLDRDGRRKGLEMMRPSAAEEVRVKPGTGKSREEKVEDAVIIKEVASPEVISGNGDDLASEKKISGSGIVPSSALEIGDDLASGKNGSSGVMPSSVSESGDDLASGKNSSSAFVPSSVSENGDDLAGGKDIISVVASSVAENGDDLAGGKDIVSVVASSVSENGDDLGSGKNSSFEIVPSILLENADDLGSGKNSSFEIAPSILSENADDLGSGKNGSFEIVPSILSENADDLGSGKNSSLEIVPSILLENANDLASGKNCSFGIVPSILSENADDLASEKNISLEIVPEILSENGDDSASEKNSSCVTVVNGLSGESDETEDVKLKLKELRREEEIAKAKKAMERKKKLAEKNAAKAAIKAQKEAEKKLKEQEKKARKKVTASTASSEQAEDEKADEDAGTLTRVRQGIYNRRDKFWRKHKPKGSDEVLKAILKRRRSANYWFWAVTIALFLAVFTVLGYCLFLQKL